MSRKTYVPFKNSQTADNDGLPRAAEVVTLFNSITACGNSQCVPHMNWYWFTFAIAPATNSTGNNVTADFSMDKGVSWTNFYSSNAVVANEPVGDSTLFRDEIAVGEYLDFRVQYTNGALKQSAFKCNMTLDASERAPSET